MTKKILHEWEQNRFNGHLFGETWEECRYLLLWLFKQLKRKIPIKLTYNPLETCEEEHNLLCKTISEFTHEQANKLMYCGGRTNIEARALALWWDHCGAQYTEDEKSRRKMERQKEIRDLLKSKLSAEEIEAVGLDGKSRDE